MSLETWATRFERWANALRLARPTPSPESSATTTTPSTRSGTSEAVQLVTMMGELMEKSQAETRRLVMEILQGRESTGGPSSSESLSLGRLESEPFQVPDYDREANDDLPAGIQAVFHREDDETTQMRVLQTEQALLAQQLAEARRRAGMDEGGPRSEPSSSRGSNGPRPPDAPTAP